MTVDQDYLACIRLARDYSMRGLNEALWFEDDYRIVGWLTQLICLWCDHGPGMEMVTNA